MKGMSVECCMTPSNFAAKWERVTTTERASAQSHFLDLCELLEVPKPLDVDPDGTFYTFERAVTKAVGGKGFADVWKRGFFAWEYKGKRKNLLDAYGQLVLYAGDLENPPLLVVCDLYHFEVHTNFTGTPKQVHRFTVHDLQDPKTRQLLSWVFTDPERLNPKYHRESVTREASQQVAALAAKLSRRGHDPETVAHFMMQLVFAFFAEDVGLLPDKLVTRILERTAATPERAQRYISELFQAMATGGEVLLEDVPYFNGGLFDNRGALPLEADELRALLEAAKLDWGQVEPAIFGTLFERSLDPAKRSQLGAHYTSREDILRIVEPVVLAPLRAEWEALRAHVDTFVQTTDLSGLGERAAQTQRNRHINGPIADFLGRLQSLKVLDPACGSGNFLYVAMQQLKELEREVVAFAQSVGAPGFQLIGPRQFYGLELSVFAHELASIVVWIGYLQWNHLNGLSNRQTPILERLDTIRRQDALLDGEGETEWPEAEFIVGNPPFLGDKRMRGELGDAYVEKLRELFRDRVPGQADFVCYWFEKSRAHIEQGKAKRAGLISTNSIRGGASRKVLESIKETGDMFMAWADEPWILEGAAVRVSLVGFDDGTETARTLDGKPAAVINPDLTGSTDVTQAKVLSENQGVAFIGIQKGGAFDIPGDLARSWLKLPNPNGRSNTDVLRPYVNGMDITRWPSDTWIIDFNQLGEQEASEYIVPFGYVEENIKPERLANRDKASSTYWWLHQRTRPDMRHALNGLSRYLATPRVAKHRLWVYVPVKTLVDSRIVVVTDESMYTFGVLHSRLHEVWSLATCSWHGVGNDPTYNAKSCFETFPFPHPTETQRADIEKWAKYLDDVRTQLVGAEQTRTLTKLYNDLTDLRATRDSNSPVYPLLLAHEKLDAAVAAAYGWAWPLSDDEILAALLALNLERAAA